jgi:hypothetical protein
MPRYASQNLAALDPEYRKANNISLSGNNNKSSRYSYGKQNNVFIASGRELTENGLCFRLLPMYEGEGDKKEFAQFRQGREDVAAGDWCRLVTCAHWVGNPGVCYIVHDGNPALNLYESPLHVLRKAAWDNKETPGIGRLFSELLLNQFTRDSHIGTLRKPEETLFISASAVYVKDNQITLGAFDDNRSKEERDRGARIIGLKKSAAQALLSALRVRDENGEFLVDDMLSFGPAKLVTFLPNGYQSGGQKLMGVGVDGPEAFHCPKYVRSSNKGAQFVVGYPQSRTDVTHFAIVHDTYMDQQVTLEPYADRIVAETQTFDDYLWVPTYEEQAEMLANAFPREALEFAWQEFPEYMRTIPKGTTTSAGSVRVEEMPEESPAIRRPPVAQSRPIVKPPKAADPVGAPWGDAPTGEISEEEAAGVADMFASAEPARPASAAVSGDTLNPAEILERAKAKLAAKKK